MQLELRVVPTESGDSVAKRSFNINATRSLPRTTVTFDLQQYFKQRGKPLDPKMVNSESV
jgi:hypothetical protein